MANYLIKRLLIIIPALLGLSVIVFALIKMAPGDPYLSMLDPLTPPADRENMLRSIGYYDPVPLQYLKWMGRMVQGDMGYSIRYGQPVADVLGMKIGPTLLLSVISLILSSLIAVPLGVISATRQYSFVDYLATVFAFIGISIPAFFLALLAVKLFAIDLSWFPISGMEYVGQNNAGFARVLDVARHMALPVVSLTLVNTASLMRYTRSAMLEVISMDYIRTARAKGLGERSVIYTHALKNAMIPVITSVTASLGTILSGSVLIETIFAWPGMGTLVFQSIKGLDYPLIMGGAMTLAVCVLIANILADVLYTLVDPRIRFE